MTTTESSVGSGPTRGRGLDALFESSPAPSSSASEIDPELAAMLQREVRAGAPSIESIASISLPVEPAVHDEEAAAGGDVRAARVIPFPARGVISADGSVVLAEDEAIDLPSLFAGLPSIETPSAVTRAPETPVALPQAPGARLTIPAGGEQPLPPAVRIGAVIIDGSPSRAGAASPEAGPAGELIVSEQSAVPTVIAPGERDVLPPGPGVRPPSQPVPLPQQLAEDQKTIIISRLDEVREIGWQRALHQQIDELYKQVVTEFSSPPGNADQMLTLLQEARQILLESPENYVAAEYRIAQVRSTMSRTRESRQQSAHLAPRVFVYEVVWLALLLLGLVFAAPLAEIFTRAGNIAGATASDVFPFWNTLMWGGIGGIIGALYALWWHVSDQQDFDRQYLMWYFVQPIMGVVLGGIVFLLLTGGFLILQIKPSDPNAGARLLPYLAAVLAGFRQNFIYNQLDRLIGLFAPSGNQNGGSQG